MCFFSCKFVHECIKHALLTDQALINMTLSGRYKQYVYPGMEPKANGISNFVDDDTPKDECTHFDEVQYMLYKYVHVSLLFLDCGRV